MRKKVTRFYLPGLFLGLALATPAFAQVAPYPQSNFIDRIAWDFASREDAAPGSDLWPITWGADNHLYTSWGDGGGFGGTNEDGRVKLGVARIEGTPENLNATNVFGGKNAEASATFVGKASGILSVGGALYMWVQEEDAWNRAKIGKSTDGGNTWTFNSGDPDDNFGWDFAATNGLFTNNNFLQFGRDYAGARDEYVYVYAQDKIGSPWTNLSMFRVHKDSIMDTSRFEYFAGLDSSDNPQWTSNISSRRPVFTDPNGISFGTRVSYNPGLNRYFLTIWHGKLDGSWAMFDAPEPWGPWTTVAYYGDGAWIDDTKKFGFAMPAKWLSADGRDFVMVFSGPSYDRWNTIRGTFISDGSADTIAPDKPTNLRAD